MDLAADITRNCLWHAFIALDINGDGRVSKSKLLVLTASIGNMLNIQNTEKGLSEHRSTAYLQFEDYMFYLQKEVFSCLPKEISPQQFKRICHDITDICWLVYKHKYASDCNSYGEEYYFKLFSIFCVVSEFYIGNNKDIVTLDSSELIYISELMDRMLGVDIVAERTLPSVSSNFSFIEFFAFIEEFYMKQYEKSAVLEAVNEIYSMIVENIIKKGCLKKSLSPVGPWWELWFVLTQHSLSWSYSNVQKDQQGEVNFYADNIEVDNGSGAQFSLIVGSKRIVLHALDCATKMQWIAAINIAIKHSKTLEPFQKYCANTRREMRNKIRRKLEEERQLLGQKEEAFEQEKKSKIQLEQTLQKEMERLKDLELKEKILYAQLEEERQAKKDEEIVRRLQSRLLAEEWEKMEAMEQQQKEQEQQLQMERRKREELEDWQKKRTAEIDQLENVVSSLEKEKEHLHGTLKRTKIILAETVHVRPPNAESRTLKRSVSADLSSADIGKWSLLSSTEAENC